MRFHTTTRRSPARLRPALTRLEDRNTPAIFIVGNLNDDVPGSLRAAVTNANNLPGADEIKFNAPLAGQITLTKGEIAITDALTITGPGAGVITVSGNYASRILNINTLTIGGPVSISGLTFMDGLVPAASAGGAIFNQDEALTISKCVFNNNAAGTGGAIAVGTAAGSLTIDGSFLSSNKAGANGGAVSLLAGSAVTVRTSTLAGNVATKSGGGLAFNLGGTLKLENSTLAQNTAVGGPGGGLFFTGTTTSLNVKQCTLSGNIGVGGGGVALSAFTGTLLMRNSTVHLNQANGNGAGGGLAQLGGPGNIQLESTIVSGNINVKAPDIASAVKVDVANCAIGANAGFVLGGAAANLPFGANLKLGPLAINGGGNPTHLQAGNSPVINKGTNPDLWPTDQRGAGFPRPLNGLHDIGAVETAAAPPRVAGVVINGGQLQRSKVRELRVDFDSLVTIPTGPPSLWVELKHQVTGVLITLMPTTTHTDVTSCKIEFSGPGVVAGALPEGRYTLRLKANNITNVGGMLDGNGDGTGGDDYVVVSSGMAGIYSLFGDMDGDADVDALDFGAFRPKFGLSGIIDPGDFDGDGDVDALDFGALRQRFGTSI